MPRSSREKSAETRARIVEAAYRLFVEKGYNATAMRDISRAAGVTVGAIYNHFETKEDIWREVIVARHPYHEIIPLIEQAKGDSVADVLRSAAHLLVQELSKRPDLFNLMFIEIVEFNARHVPDLARAVVPQVTPLAHIFEGKKGRLRQVPPPLLLRSFGGLFFSYYITGMFMKGMNGVGISEDSLDQFVDIYLHGILQDEEPEGDKA